MLCDRKYARMTKGEDDSSELDHEAVYLRSGFILLRGSPLSCIHTPLGGLCGIDGWFRSGKKIAVG